MGRGTRSNDDHCVVLLSGSRLTRYLYVSGGTDYLTTATRAQLELSEQMTDQLSTPEIDEVEKTMAYCLERDKEWVRASKGALASLKYRREGTVHSSVPRERAAFDAGRTKQFKEATEELQVAVNEAMDDRHKGWLKQELATYTNPFDPAEAQIIQRSALSLNTNLFRPLDGIAYVKLDGQLRDQSIRCEQYFGDSFETTNHLVIAMKDILDRLEFKPETAKSFEKAFRDLGELLGHNAHRPESEYGSGPDVLWSVGDLSFFVIEAKNGATTDRISKHDANQLSGSMNWFSEKYGVGATAVPIIIHPSRQTDSGATAHPDARALRKDGLSNLKDAVRQFINGVGTTNASYEAESIGQLLRSHDLTPDKFVEKFTVSVTPAT